MKNKSRLRWQLIIFLVLFSLAEIILRLFGISSGTLIRDLKYQDKPVYQPRFYSDEAGINHLIAGSEVLMPGTVINKQGFRGNIDYTPQTVDSLKQHSNKEVLMVVGDSFVEGCCPDNVKNSFPDIIGRTSGYAVLNFGVAGTDPLQYELVVQKYAARLKPHRVVVVIYLGNDFFDSKRLPSPGTPLNFPFKNNIWLYAQTEDLLSGQENYVLKNPDEAYKFYIDHYTLKGSNRNSFEKALNLSVILSKLYLETEYRLAARNWKKKNKSGQNDETAGVYETLKKINSTCASCNLPCLFLAIPPPMEAADASEKIHEKYKNYFKDINWFVPSTLSASDYDGPKTSNHFNNLGHAKFARFMVETLNATKNPSTN